MCSDQNTMFFYFVFLQSSYLLFLNSLASVWDGMQLKFSMLGQFLRSQNTFHEELSLKLVWLATSKYLECPPSGGKSLSPSELVPFLRQLNRELVSGGLC